MKEFIITAHPFYFWVLTFPIYIRSFRRLYASIQQQRKFINAFLMKYVEDLQKNYNGLFHKGQVEKIKNYYGLFIPAVLAASYKKLYNEPFTYEERKRVTLFGILTPVGDDLFDIDKLHVDEIRLLTYNPEAYEAQNFSAKVAKEIQSYLLHHVPDKNAYLNASKNVFEIQIETIKQTNPLITDEEIERITYAKGGYSVIIYHETLKKASPEMWQALFYAGSLMQLANDIFDMHKDVPDGIYTLPNRCTDFSALKKKYMDRVAECYRLIYALPYTKKNKTEFCIVMNFIISRGVVALDHFINLEKEKGRPLHIASLTRKEIICDMQKPSNILRWLKYMYTLPKTYLK